MWRCVARARVQLLFAEECRAQNHSHGLVWNPRGEDFFVELSSAAAQEDSEAGL
jgi:hypothetical protein